MVIDCHADEFSAQVRHCTRHGLGWLVGVEFDPDSGWANEVDSLGSLIEPRLVGRIAKSGNRQ